VAHCPATAICVWFHFDGVQPVVAWHVVQLVAAVKVVWSVLAPLQVVVLRWQFSHTVWPTCTCVVGLMLDGRGRPLQLPAEQAARVAMLTRWYQAVGLYPAA
jgi:hypothetical protein